MPKLNLIASFYWLCLAQKVVSGDDLYRKVGGEIVLKPDESTVPDTITSILWKHGKNKVADWDKAFSSILDFYATFKERTTLDLTTGELKISGLMKTDSGVYSAMFNGKLLDKTYQLSVIKAVPKPTITSSCKPDKISCTLTCEGDTTDAEPVAYSWKVGDGLWEVRDKQMNVSKSNTGKSTNSYKYICMLENSVSSEVSEPVGEVFGPEPSEVGGVGVGVVVVVIILVLVANVITGIWWVWKKKKGYPEDTWIYFLRMFCSRFCGDAGNNQNSVAPDTVYHAVGDIQVANGGSSVVLSGVAVDTVYSTVMEKSPRDYSMNQSNNNQSTNTAKGSDGVQPYKEVLLTDITKTNEDDADKAEKGQENEGSNDTTKTVVSVGPGGNDKTKTDVSVGPGGNDKTKADVSVGPGGNDEIKTYVSVGPGGNDEIKTDVSVGPRGNDDTKADVSVGPGGNDDTKADVSVGPGGNDETKTDGSVGPGGNDKTKADVSVGPGGNDETKADVSVGPGGDINSAEKGEANGEESKLLNENTVNHHNDNGDGAEEENSVL